MKFKITPSCCTIVDRKDHEQLKLNMILPVNNRTATRCNFKSHYYHPFYSLQMFTFLIQTMFSLISSDANGHRCSNLGKFATFSDA